MGYILGFGGCAYCQDCGPDDPCAAAAPVLSTYTQGDTACVGIAGSWGSYSGSRLAGATWSASGLPSGVSINASTGFITGTPSGTSSGSVTVTVANACGSSNKTFTFTVDSPATITSSLTDTATVGSAYSYTITSSGSPISYLATGLPAGLSYNSGTGVISGTPTAAGTFNVVITAYDAVYCYARNTLVLTVGCASCVTYFPNGTVTNTNSTLIGPYTLWTDDLYDVTGGFPCAQTVTLSYSCNNTMQVEVKLNGSTAHSGSCVASYSGSLSVPAGTTSIEVIVTVGCAGFDTTFMTYAIEC